MTILRRWYGNATHGTAQNRPALVKEQMYPRRAEFFALPFALKAQLLAPGLARPPGDLYFFTAFKSQFQSLTKPWGDRFHET
jgi:hypothetical protein